MAVSTKEKNAKLRKKGSCGGHVTHFCSFGPSISRKRLKLQTSNLAQKWTAASTNENTMFSYHRETAL